MSKSLRAEMIEAADAVTSQKRTQTTQPVAKASKPTRGAKKPKPEKPAPAVKSAKAAKPEKPAKPVKEPKLKPGKEIRDSLGDARKWHALNWNDLGGQEARHYPYVVAKAGVEGEGGVDKNGKPVPICLAGPSGRLLRFASQDAASSVADSQNQTRLDFQ